MIKNNSIINTPKLLQNASSLKSESDGQTSSSPVVTLTKEEIEKEQQEKFKTIGAERGTYIETNSNNVNTNTDTLEDGEFWTKAADKKEALQSGRWDKSKPNGYKIGQNQIGGKYAPFKMKTISMIVLHHTATMRTVEYEQEKFSKKSISSNAIIGVDGQIEYVVPLPFIANAQGMNIFNNGKQSIKGKFNTLCTSVELTNVGYLNKETTKQGKTYWSRGNYEYEESLVSQAYDFNGNPLKLYKSGKRCLEYTDAQLNAMVNWIKKQQNYIAENYPENSEILNWKFTQKTYNQMFPNFQSKKLPKSFKNKGGKYFDGPNNEYLIAGMTRKKKNGKAYNSNKYGFAVSRDAWDYKPGIYSHNSIDAGKSDVFPTKKMIECLKNNFR